MTMFLSDRMTSVIPSATAGSIIMSGIQMIPLISMARARAEKMAGGMAEANITSANTAVGNYFMVNDIRHTQPMDPLVHGSGFTASPEMKNCGMTITAMSQEANNFLGMP
jgi:hypothetical protein